METEHFPYKIAAIYADAETARAAQAALHEAQLGDVQIFYLHPDNLAPQQAIEPEQRATRNHFIEDILAGTGVGTVIGAAGAGVIAATLPSLFVSVPVVGPLMVAGYGATLGATAGAIKGLRVKEGILAAVVQDALRTGSHVVLVHAVDEATREHAEAVVEETLTLETRSV